MYRLRSETLAFIDNAPRRWIYDAPVLAAPEDVFAAISADPSTWTWFPGITSGRYEGPGPHGVGSIREARMGPSIYRETIIAWETPTRWVYRVDQMTVPLAKALVEEWKVEPAPGGSVVRWTFAIDPRPLFTAALPFAPRAMGRLFRRAMSNLGSVLQARPGAGGGRRISPRQPREESVEESGAPLANPSDEAVSLPGSEEEEVL